ncbi:Sec-independent protein translocase protein TatA [Rhodanobacter sp. Root179]|uniref:Sec-independent protein translocase subunit TatA n=1 Tax=unclassified Rhodanobacter TaxID=2621553 RepID=UPI0006F2E1CC|nr:MULTISPECIES: Sec-independent protein translocase subunit TatA [unclassified Rhodanobacter]KQZ79643.1 preprotein translocase subunit TatA [Rhodanobacter sp. Root561]KRB43513.1 preprotein translocase subunit TatA [Rhodanobacter sp. Root179]
MSIWHLIILLVVVVVIFGTGKLRNIGSDLGGAMRDFKKGLNGDEEEAKRKEEAERLRADPPASSAGQTTQSQRDSSDPK